MVGPIVPVVEGHADEILPLPPGTGDQRPPRLAGVAGLHAGAAVILPEELVVVGQRPPLQGNGLRRDDPGDGLIVQAGPPQLCHVQGGGIVPRIPQAVGVGEMGARHAQIDRPLVHPLHERCHVPGAVAGQRHRRVVAGVEQKAIEQRLHLQDLSGSQIEGGPLDARPLRLDLHRPGQVAPQRLHRHQRRHELRGAGHGAGGVLVLGI